MKLLYLTLILSVFNSYQSIACTGGTTAGTVNPTSTAATINIATGKFLNVNVICGFTYTFSFCSNGGSATFDSQLTINQTDNTTQLAYNDDFCSLQSQVTWTATFTGSIHVLVSLYSCTNNGANSGTLSYISSPPTFTYSPSCTSANASINNSCGGTFTFNPVPTDGAVIDATTGFISNAVSGAHYTVKYTIGATVLTTNLTMQSPPCYIINGNGTQINVAGQNCIQLTAAQNDQTGCAWSESIIDFNSNFTLSLDYYFGNNVNGADGTTFTFQPNPSACGANGAQLGAGGIPNSLVVEFDTYDNDGIENNDLACDHIAVEIDGDLPDDPINFPANQVPYCGPICAINGGSSIENNATHQIEITWNATTHQLSIYFDGNLRLNCSGDFVNTVFGGDHTVYWGATAATGGLNNQQYFCPQTVILLPVEISAFYNICQSTTNEIIWTSNTEYNLDYYVVESTRDGQLFLPISTINAHGNSQEVINYSINVTSDQVKGDYIRLKSVDLDGTIQTSDIIKLERCLDGNSQKIVSQLNEGGLIIHSENNEEFEYSLIDLNGKTIINGIAKEGEVLENLRISQGIYLLNVRFTKDGTVNQSKLIAH